MTNIGWARAGESGRRTRRGRRYAGAFLVAALLVAACGDDEDDAGGTDTEDTATQSSGAAAADTTGVTDTEIKVSLLAGWSGVNAAATEEFFQQGFVTWQNEVNDAGGINGRLVVAEQVDTNDTAAGGVAACREAADNGSYLVVVWGGLGDAVNAATDCLDDEGVLNLTLANPNPDWSTTFTTLTSAEDTGRVLAAYVDEELDGSSATLGALFVSDSSFVASKDGYVEALEARGLELAASEAVEPGAASFTPQLLRLQDAGVDNLAIFGTAEAIGILRDLDALDWEPQVVGASWSFDFVVQAAQGTGEGAIAVGAGVASDSPAFAEFQAKREAFNPSESPLFTDAVLAYGYSLLIGEVLTRAGEEPTAQSLLEGLESMTDYDNGILPPISYGPDDHVGPEAAFPVECCTPQFTWRGLGPAVAAD